MWEQEPPLSQEEIEGSKEEVSNHSLLRSLWFKEHPLHGENEKRVREALEKKYSENSDGECVFCPTFLNLKVPQCIHDTLDGLPEWAYSPYRGMSEEEAIACEQEKYRKKIAEQGEFTSGALLAQAEAWAKEGSVVELLE